MAERPMAEREEQATELATQELMARVRQIQVRMRRLVDDALAGAYRSTFRGSGVEFEEVRPYQPGDDVRSIDWNRTARAGDAYVKTYVEERELTLQFVCDVSASMDFGSRTFSKRETAAQFVALLSFVAVQAQDQVGLALARDGAGLHLPIGRGMGHVSRVIREVLAPRPTDSGGAAAGPSLAETLEDQLRILRRRALVFVISDFRFAAGEPPLRDVLARLGQKHDVVCVRVVDPLEEELPESGWIELEDPETGRRLDVDASSGRVRAAWAAAAARRREELAELSKKARVDVIELATTGDVADPVARYFRRRRRGRGAVA